MALSDSERQALRDAAEDAGLDPAELIAVAEEVGRPAAAADTEKDGGEHSQPIAERLLIGFLPFIRVRELRRIWLKLDEDFPDEDMPIADWMVKHGAKPAAGSDE